MFLHSWVLFPVVAFILCVGCGLLVDRIAGRPLPGALIAPVGMAAVVVIASFFTWPEATAPLTPWALAVAAIAGYVVGWGRLRASLRRWRHAIWPGVAALLPAGMMSLPVLVTGKAGFTGYGRIVDLAYQIAWAGYLQTGGQGKPDNIGSSFNVIADKLAAIHYPAGGQAALGALSRAAGIDVIWAWQPFMAGLGAVLGLALYVLLKPAIADPRLRAVAAGVAAQPTILFSYAMTSGIKELGGVALIILAAALLVLYPPSEGGLRRVVPLSIALAGAVSAFSVGAIPWIGMFALLLFVSELLRAHAHRVRVVGMWVWMTLLAVVLGLPAVVSGVTIAQIATAGGPEGLGNLAAAVPVWSAAGVWLTPDYRFPIADGGAEVPTIIGIVLVLVLAIIGIAWSVRRRLLVYVALGVAGVVALAYVARASATWSDFKAITVTAPFILTLGFVGAAAVGMWRRTVGIALGGLVVVGVLAGNFLFFHGTSFAPYDRLHDLEQIAEQVRRPGPVAVPGVRGVQRVPPARHGRIEPLEPGELRPGLERAGAAGPAVRPRHGRVQARLPELAGHDRAAPGSDVEPTARQLAPRRDDAVPRDLEEGPGRAADRRPHRLPRRPEGAHEGEEAPEARVHDAAHRPRGCRGRRRGPLRHVAAARAVLRPRLRLPGWIPSRRTT